MNLMHKIISHPSQKFNSVFNFDIRVLPVYAQIPTLLFKPVTLQDLGNMSTDMRMSVLSSDCHVTQHYSDGQAITRLFTTSE
jgi:hypothetical protein